MVFLALIAPPDDRDGRVRWYLVRDGELLTLESAGLPSGPAPGAAGSFPPTAGIDVETDTDPLFLGTLDGVGCWAVGVTVAHAIPADARWESLRSLGASVTAQEWNVAARAVHLIDWARTSRFCGRCGTATHASPGERAMVCPNCGLSAYPRVAPAVIVLVHRDDEVLLARNGRFRGGMFSVLAGFVEPGETLEDTVHREIAEEVGVRLLAPKYVASQPWPFPHSLMVGFTAEWAGGDIEVDGDEIVEAGWYGRSLLPELPPSVSIARRLIDRWLAAGDDHSI
jgi:NAD+ diphosphatase